MSNLPDLNELFAVFGKPGETPDNAWREATFRNVREHGRLVAFHETTGVWPGCTVIYLFEGHYFAEYKTTVCGPFETFDKAAKAIHFFYVTESAPSAWVDSEILNSCKMPSHWTVLRVTAEHTFLLPIPPDAEGRLPLGDEETPLEQMAREIDEKLRTQGITVTHATKPVGPQPLVASFHRAKNTSPKPPGPLPKDLPIDE